MIITTGILKNDPKLRIGAIACTWDGSDTHLVPHVMFDYYMPTTVILKQLQPLQQYAVDHLPYQARPNVSI